MFLHRCKNHIYFSSTTIPPHILHFAYLVSVSYPSNLNVKHVEWRWPVVGVTLHKMFVVVWNRSFTQINASDGSVFTRTEYFCVCCHLHCSMWCARAQLKRKVVSNVWRGGDKWHMRWPAICSSTAQPSIWSFAAPGPCFTASHKPTFANCRVRSFYPGQAPVHRYDQ